MILWDDEIKGWAGAQAEFFRKRQPRWAYDMLNDPQQQNSARATPSLPTDPAVAAGTALTPGAGVYTPWYWVEGRDVVVFWLAGTLTSLNLVVQGIVTDNESDSNIFTLASFTSATPSQSEITCYVKMLRLSFAAGSPGPVTMMARQS